MEAVYLIEFGIWLQDNYSQNRYSNNKDIMLPKGQMRKDFTDDVYTMTEIVEEYLKKQINNVPRKKT